MVDDWLTVHVFRTYRQHQNCCCIELTGMPQGLTRDSLRGADRHVSRASIQQTWSDLRWALSPMSHLQMQQSLLNDRHSTKHAAHSVRRYCRKQRHYAHLQRCSLQPKCRHWGHSICCQKTALALYTKGQTPAAPKTLTGNLRHKTAELFTPASKAELSAKT